MYIPNKPMYDALTYLTERLPVHGLDLMHKVTGDDKWANISQVLGMVWDKVDQMIVTFDFFVDGDWEYENSRAYETTYKLTDKSRLEFPYDTKVINW